MTLKYIFILLREIFNSIFFIRETIMIISVDFFLVQKIEIRYISHDNNQEYIKKARFILVNPKHVTHLES